MFGAWFMPHIGEEVLKAMFASPTITNDNSPTAIVNIIRTVGIVATTVHVFPSNVFGGLGKAMFDVSAAPCAAATVRGAVHQISRLNVPDRTTNTFTHPQCLSATTGD